jgi:hypothetical protein
VAINRAVTNDGHGMSKHIVLCLFFNVVLLVKQFNVFMSCVFNSRQVIMNPVDKGL